ncbi:MAG: hypothetical protein OSJ67_02045 [Clostridia bacterium]|nr:hypothetical protein [Clostridia bacterium]
MIRTELQSKLDIEKWLESETKGRDMCGEYDYCAYCENEKEFPCASAYLRLEGIKARKADIRNSAKTIREKSEPVKILDKEQKSSEENVTMKIKAKSRSLTFEEKLAAADDSVKAIYNEIISALEDKRVKDRITKTCHNFIIKRQPIAKIKIMKRGLQIYFALDPNDEAYAKIPHKDAGDKKTYAKTPFVLKVSSQLSIKRAKKLISDILK